MPIKCKDYIKEQISTLEDLVSEALRKSVSSLNWSSYKM